MNENPIETTPKQWYTLRVSSGQEKQAKKMLEEQISRNDCSDFFGDILIPTEEVVEIRGGQRRKTDSKFFPGYLFVHMEMNEKTWYLVRHSPKIFGFVGGESDKPMPLTDEEIESIKSRVEEGHGDKPRPKVLYNIGESVRVIDGPFKEFSGVVEDVDFDNNRLTISVSIFGRKTPVQLEFNQLEKS